MAWSDCIGSTSRVRHAVSKAAAVVLVALLGAPACAAQARSTPARPAAAPRGDARAFIAQLDATVPSHLQRAGVPGGSVALIRNGEVVALRAYGLADRQRRTPVTPQTVFNVGSISKTVTAWGVMRLVEQGKIGLDDPVERYLRRWHLPPSEWDVDGVTVRRLLSHTAGLSLPSVRELRPEEPMPTLVDALSDSAGAVRQIAAAGTTFRYSGGGYEVLQLMVEDVTGRRFADFMRDEVLLPLGMRSSTFDTLALSLPRTATPYDSGRAIARWRYAGLAAAGLYSTADDLARFVAAGLRGANGEPPGRGVLTPTTVATMQTPAPASSSGFGFFYGLGYNLFPLGNALTPAGTLGDGALAPGHMGQNTGWGAVTWSIPVTGDGFVMLTNHSQGFEAYRWALCDWVRWAALPSFGYICRGRAQQAMGPMGARLYAGERRDSSARLAFVDSLAQRATSDSTPGLAVLVVRDGRVMHSAGYGLADLSTREPITAATPFYLASVTKQLTAMAVMRLVRDGVVSYDDAISRFVPGLDPATGGVTVRQLLTHSAGVPNYYDFLRNWSRLGRLDNAAVLDTLRGKPLDFAPGTRAKYSNSGYILLATMIERATGQSFARALSALVLDRAGMRDARVLDGDAPFPARRAVGYDSVGGRIRLSDYGAFETADGRRVYTGMRTVGAGGVYASLRDMAAWVAALDAHTLLDEGSQDEAFRIQVPSGGEGIDSVAGYGYGWIISRRHGADIVWHNGGLAGFRTVVVRVPSQHLSVVVLSNAGWVKPSGIAVAVVDRLVAAQSP